MKYVYTINSIGLNIVYFASKKSALNYAKAHNIRKLRNDKWGIIRISEKSALEIRNDFNARLFEINSSKLAKNDTLWYIKFVYIYVLLLYNKFTN